jgi:DNA invertase Pin-like site-specific DNA recombinase
MKLPATLDDLHGLRAARWVRESTRGQYDTFGPEAQREQQDRALERYGLVESELSWSVAHSGRTVANTTQFRDMVARAGTEYDVLVVGYVSRFARDLRTAVNARHDLHAAGAAILFCDERVLTSDEDAWELFAREAVEAEAYSRRLGKRIREGYAAKFRRLADQAGNPGWGFRRTAGRLEPDPLTIGAVVRAFERFASGNVTTSQIADEFGVGVEQVRKALRNPIYNGWALRHRGRERMAAFWRSEPPVSDELWARVQDVRRARTRGGCAPGKWRRGIDPLGGLLHCACGARVRTNGTSGTPPRRQRIHPSGECPLWGLSRTVSASRHELPIYAQVGALKLDNATIEKVIRAVGDDDRPPLPLDRTRVEREKRELALGHAAGNIADAQYLARMAELRRSAVPVRDGSSVRPADAVSYLRNLALLWESPGLTDATRADLLHAIYERVVVTRDQFVEVQLTPHAYRHGLALALPEVVHWRPRQDPGPRHSPRCANPDRRP